MLDTTLNLFLGENRAIELEISDESFSSVPISGAFYEVFDENKNLLINETLAVITDVNKISMIVSSDIFVKSGVYYIIWKIITLNQEFKLRTQLYIKDVI